MGEVNRYQLRDGRMRLVGKDATVDWDADEQWIPAADYDALLARLAWLEEGIKLGMDEYWPTSEAGKVWLAAEPKDRK